MNWIARASPLVLLGLLLWKPSLASPLLQLVAGPDKPALYELSPLWLLTLLHLRLVVLSVGLSSLCALGLAIWVTRPGSASRLSLFRTVVSASQTFPPVAVLALLVPVLGFGEGSVLVALFLYALLPVFEVSVASLLSVSPVVREAARGCGLRGWQGLLGVELVLALPGVLVGVRLAVVTGLGLGAIGSTVGARGLGEVIVAGLLSGNGAFVLQGAGLVALLALGVSGVLEGVRAACGGRGGA